MRIVKADWQKTFMPFVWRQPWAGMFDTAPEVAFINGDNYRLSIRKPCDHDFEVLELHGDQRLDFNARYIDVCSKCRRMRKHKDEAPPSNIMEEKRTGE